MPDRGVQLDLRREPAGQPTDAGRALAPRRAARSLVKAPAAPVAITILVRNPGATHRDCQILYHDIGDYLTREQKLAILREAGSVAGVDGWQEVAPDQHHDWIGQRSESFPAALSGGVEGREDAGRTGQSAIFKLFSNGYKTSQRRLPLQLVTRSRLHGERSQGQWATT